LNFDTSEILIVVLRKNEGDQLKYKKKNKEILNAVEERRSIGHKVEKREMIDWIGQCCVETAI
jgi:hypothetical protein